MHLTTVKTPSAGWNLDLSYTQLPSEFYAPARPADFALPQLVIFNAPLAAALGLQLDQQDQQYLADLFCGKLLPEGATPIAQAYAGHQFGHFTMLGDGRAILLGEQVTPKGERFDIQFKGSGQTPFSRRGDGKAALGPMLREYIISEAMHALGIPTTRSLAVVATGEPIYRETVLPGAILTRVASSHIRVGTFEFAASRSGAPGYEGHDLVKALADYTIARHFPEIGPLAANRYVAFFDAVADRQAQLIAQWQCVGFIHGVMNTDNMAIAGETIDYGPCAFMDQFDAATVFSSIDHQGRYAFGNQPRIGSWNLARFAETLLHLVAPDEKEAIATAQAALTRFHERFNFHYSRGMRHKLGLQREEDEDNALITGLLELMQKHAADYTNTFRRLSHADPESLQVTGTEVLFASPEFGQWMSQWKLRLEREQLTHNEILAKMCNTNPAVIPRNHRVEEALAAATEQGSITELEKLVKTLQHPYVENAENLTYRSPAPQGAQPYQTFCGT